MEILSGDINLGNILEGSSATVIDIIANWCAPCKVVGAILEEVEKQYAGKVKFVKVDVSDDVPEFVKNLNIKAVPTLLFYKGDVLCARESGLKTKDQIIELINKTQN